MKAIIMTLLALALCAGSAGGQGFTMVVRDLDGDAKTDTVAFEQYQGQETWSIVCLLSSQNFKLAQSKNFEFPVTQKVDTIAGGFCLRDIEANGNVACGFRYEPATKRIRLITMRQVRFGNLSESAASGYYDIDFLTGKASGYWAYTDEDTGEPVDKIIDTTVSCPVIYLEDFNDGTYSELGTKYDEEFSRQ